MESLQKLKIQILQKNITNFNCVALNVKANKNTPRIHPEVKKSRTLKGFFEFQFL